MPPLNKTNSQTSIQPNQLSYLSNVEDIVIFLAELFKTKIKNKNVNV